MTNHWKILLRTDQISPEILILTPTQSITPARKTQNISIGNIKAPGVRGYFVFPNTQMMSLCQHWVEMLHIFVTKTKTRKAPIVLTNTEHCKKVQQS